ncbi:MAG: TetR/AcrR family transcriptional regulator [Spirochaeta sp.]|nr:TetR/AcrR family transcriptional regulator [Spirochaeta sp.]
MEFQRSRTGANRERIIQAAAKLIIERGVANTSLADIAKEVGISKGTLYYYYASKGDLIFDVTERHMAYVGGKILTWLEESGKGMPRQDVIRMVFRTMIRSKKRGQIRVYLIEEALRGNDSIRERFIQEYERWRQMIEDGLRKIFSDDREFETMSQVMLATMDGLLLQQLMGVQNISLDRISRFIAGQSTAAQSTAAQSTAMSNENGS